ncbi:uncharacterized protein METZ01_LOCUS236865 [marine metagenome]|uniref:Uncharacterized protein n=1 Tax=marine metagenome TaxID=408172 RepID=A0A382HC23_9ZZZZ
MTGTLTGGHLDAQVGIVRVDITTALGSLGERLVFGKEKHGRRLAKPVRPAAAGAVGGVLADCNGIVPRSAIRERAWTSGKAPKNKRKSSKRGLQWGWGANTVRAPQFRGSLGFAG